MKPWDDIIPQHEQEAYRAAGLRPPHRPWPQDPRC